MFTFILNRKLPLTFALVLLGLLPCQSIRSGGYRRYFRHDQRHQRRCCGGGESDTHQ